MPTYLVIGANTMNCDSTTNSASASGPEFDPQRLKFRVSNVTLLNGNGQPHNTVRGFSLATLAAALAACGGGGSGGPTPPPAPPPPPPPNNAPTASDASGTVVEDGAPATGGAVGADEDGDSLTYSVTANGTYGSLETAADGSWTYTITDSDEIQALGVGATLTDTATIEVSDGEATASATVTITIQGANDDPTGSDGAGAVTAGMDMAAMGNVGAADVDAGDMHTFMVGDATSYGTLSVDEAGNWSYMVDNSNAAVMALGDGETMDDMGTIVISDNNGGSATVMVTVTITGVNDAPGAPMLDANEGALTIAENDDSGGNIGTLSSADPEGDAVTFSLDNDNFEIETIGGTAVLKYKEGMSFDYEATDGGMVTLMITATDSNGNTSEATAVTVMVTNVNEAPSLSVPATATITENMTGTVVAVDAMDPEQTIGPDDITVDDPRFSVMADGDGLALVLNEGIDADMEDSVTVELELIDAGGLAVRSEVAITVMGVNEVPTVSVMDGTTPDGISARALISEGETGPVGQIMVSDQEEILDASNITLSDNRFGTLTDADGGIWLVLNEAADHEVDGDSISVTVTVTDSDGLSASTSVDVAVVNINEGPSISVMDGETPDGMPAVAMVDEHIDGEFMPVPVGEVIVSDPEQMLTEANITVSDDRFGLVTDALGGIWLVLNEGLDADVEGGGSVTVMLGVADSGGLMAETEVTVTVNNINEGPTIMLQEGVTPAADGGLGASGTVDENDDIAIVYEIIVSDPEDDLTADNIMIDDERFATFTDSEGGLWVALVDPVNYEEEDSIDITVTVTDMDGASAMASQTVSIRDANDAPAPNQDGVLWIQAPANVVPLKNLTATAEGNVVQMTLDLGNMFSDEDGETNFRYHLEDAPAWLTLINVQYSDDGSVTGVLSGTVPAGVDVSALDVKIVATDDGGPTGMEASGAALFNIVIDDGNDRPTKITLTNPDGEENIYYQLEVNENDGSGMVLGTLTVDDQDNPLHPHGQHVWSVNNPNFEAMVSDDGTVTLKVKDGAMLDHEAAESLTLMVTAADKGTPALSKTQAITVTVHDMNDPVMVANAPGNWWVTVDEDEDPEMVAKGAYLTFSLETQAAGDTLPLFTDQDVDGANAALTYSISGADWLEIDAMGTITNKAGKEGDELPERGVYDITVTATDGAGSTQSATFKLAVAVSGMNNEDNEEPDIGSRDEINVTENARAGTVVASFTVTDDDLDLVDGDKALHPFADVKVVITNVMASETDGGNEVPIPVASLNLVETSRDATSISYNVVVTGAGAPRLDYEMYDEISFTVRAYDLDAMDADEVEFDFEISDVNEAPAYSRDAGNHSSSLGVGGKVVLVEQEQEKITLYLNLSKMFEDPDEDDDDDELTFAVSEDTPWITITTPVGEWRDIEEGPDGDLGTGDDVEWDPSVDPDGRDYVVILEIDRSAIISQDPGGGFTITVTDEQGMTGTHTVNVGIEDENLHPAAAAKGVTLNNGAPYQNDRLTMSFNDGVDPDFTGALAGTPILELYEWRTDDDEDASGDETLVSVSVDNPTPFNLAQAQVGMVIQGSVIYFELYNGAIVMSEGGGALEARSAAVKDRPEPATGSITFNSTSGAELVATVSITDPDGPISGQTYTWESSVNGRGGWTVFSDNDPSTSDTTEIPADVQGNWVRLVVEFTEADGASGRVVSDPIKVGAINTIAAPKIAGYGDEGSSAVAVGRTITVDAKGGEVAWLSGGKVIATGASLTLTDAHAGMEISARITSKTGDNLTSIADTDSVTVAGGGMADNTEPIVVDDVPAVLLGKAPAKVGDLMEYTATIDADSLFEDIEGGLTFQFFSGGGLGSDLYDGELSLVVHHLEGDSKSGGELLIIDETTGDVRFLTTSPNNHSNTGTQDGRGNGVEISVWATDGGEQFENAVFLAIDVPGSAPANLPSFNVNENAPDKGSSGTIDIQDANFANNEYGQYDWDALDDRFTIVPDATDSSEATLTLNAGSIFELAGPGDGTVTVMVVATPKSGNFAPIKMSITVNVKDDKTDDAPAPGAMDPNEVPGLKDNESGSDDNSDDETVDNDDADDDAGNAAMDAMAGFLSVLDDGMF